jgi:hypothetical protein
VSSVITSAKFHRKPSSCRVENVLISRYTRGQLYTRFISLTSCRKHVVNLSYVNVIYFFSTLNESCHEGDITILKM